MNKENITKNFIVGTFVTLYVMVSIISTIHVIDFFGLSNPQWLAITLAIAFEVGAAASLASIIVLKKMNKTIVWSLFFILTFMQAMGNTYYAYTHLSNYQHWVELFGLIDYDIISQKRILSLVSGAILPLVALGFIKSLVDYIKPDPIETPNIVAQPTTENSILIEPVQEESTINDLDAIIKAGRDAEHKKLMTFVSEQRKKRIADGETFEEEPTALANSGISERETEIDSEVLNEDKINQKTKFLDNIKVFEGGNIK